MKCKRLFSEEKRRRRRRRNKKREYFKMYSAEFLPNMRSINNALLFSLKFFFFRYKIEVPQL